MRLSDAHYDDNKGWFMNDNRWDQQGIPHKGWNCVDVIDIRADGEVCV